MRQPYKKQMTIGSIGIREIEFDLNCWHEIIPILIGLQRIYMKLKLLDQILELIKKDVLGQNKKNRFVVQTNIHHPTDANLILDGIRTMLSLVSSLAGIVSIVGWRKHGYWWCRAKKLNRRIQRIASSKKENKDEKLRPLYQELIAIAGDIIKRCKDTIATAKKLKQADTVVNSLIDELEQCIEFTHK